MIHCIALWTDRHFRLFVVLLFAFCFLISAMVGFVFSAPPPMSGGGGSAPTGCTNVAGALTCTSFTGDGTGLTGIGDSNETLIQRLIDATPVDGNDTEINRLATAIKALSTAPMNGTVGATTPASGVFTSVTADSYSTNRTDAAQCISLFEATSDGDSNATICVPAKGTGLAASRAITIPDATGTVVVTGSATGGIILGDTTPDAEGELGYASNQLSIHDGTAPRSLLQVASTTITKYQYLPSGWMVDAAASPCAANAAISGEETMARLCDDNESVIVAWQVDPEWTAGVKFRVYYALVSDASADNTVSWRVQGCTSGNSEALSCTAGDLVSVDDELGTDDDANQVMVSDWSGAVTLTGIAAGEFARITLLRGTDDYAAEVNLLGIELKYQAKISAASDY